ncbi:hypothetical protein A2U01_0102222, partial [Trifolium medium]|nr:hypothetical protein [Trifolium medium]
ACAVDTGNGPKMSTPHMKKDQGDSTDFRGTPGA